ncbi:hypothetical protein BKA80DRAFT_7961 [Phyllosticta citrichinensis]
MLLDTGAVPGIQLLTDRSWPLGLKKALAWMKSCGGKTSRVVKVRSSRRETTTVPQCGRARGERKRREKSTNARNPIKVDYSNAHNQPLPTDHFVNAFFVFDIVSLPERVPNVCRVKTSLVRISIDDGVSNISCDDDDDDDDDDNDDVGSRLAKRKAGGMRSANSISV